MLRRTFGYKYKCLPSLFTLRSQNQETYIFNTIVQEGLEVLTFLFILEVNNFFFTNGISRECFLYPFPQQCLYIVCVTCCSTFHGILLLNTPITGIEKSHLA